MRGNRLLICFMSFILSGTVLYCADMTLDNLTVNGRVKIKNYYENIIEFKAESFGDAFDTGPNKNSIKIKTNIPFALGAAMPAIYIEGYDLVSGKTINIEVAWYYTWYTPLQFLPACSSYGSCLPNIKLADENGKVAIILEKNSNESWWSARFTIRGTESRGGDQSWFDNWDIVAGTVNQGATYKDVNVENKFMNAVFTGNVGIGTAEPKAKLEILEEKRGIGDTLQLWNNETNQVGIESGPSIKFRGYYQQARISSYEDAYSRTGGNLWLQTHNGTDYNTGIFIDRFGSVGIGTTNAGNFRLAVNGTIGAKEIVVTQTNWADFVFEPDYKLKTLPEVEAYIAANKHLPDMPSEAEVKEKGANIGDVQAKLLQKIEELTLYVIELKKDNVEVQNENKNLKQEIEKIKEKIKM